MSYGGLIMRGCVSVARLLSARRHVLEGNEAMRHFYTRTEWSQNEHYQGRSSVVVQTL